MQCLDDIENQYKLGLKYLHGIGTEIDLDKAFIYIKILHMEDMFALKLV